MSNADANQEAPSPVPVPPEFAFAWEDPDDERLFWHADKMHFPEPVTPMMAGFNRTFKEGWRRAAETCSIPIQLQFQRINAYNFNAVSPRVPPEEMETVGKATGTAKVVLSLAEAGKVQPGDILVAPATKPAWTPLFATVAVVAREYNIPAVLGTGKATSVIKDGQTLEVDGDAGTVRIVTPS